MPCGQNPAPVFNRYANHLRTEVCGELKLVGNRRSKQVAGRLLTFAFIRAHAVHVVVLRAVHPLTRLLDDKIVSCDSMYRWDTSGVNRAMADSRIGGNIGDIGVLAGETFAEQALEAALAISLVKTVKVIPTHLIDHQADNQLWSLNRLLCTNVARQQAKCHSR